MKSLRAAASSEAGRPMILALATVDEAGEPQVRSVVCRHIDDDGELWITSDSRSAKHRELIRHPRAATVAWFPAAREQFRFNGPVEILDSFSTRPERADIWQALSPETRATFLWPDPGRPRVEASAFVRSSDQVVPPASFEVLVLRPVTVEQLVLTKHPHQRRRWELNGAWSVRELNP